MGQGIFKASYFHDLSKVEYTEEQYRSIEKEIRENKIMMYSKDYCYHCNRAKELLTSKDKQQQYQFTLPSKDMKIREINLEEDSLTTQGILYQMTHQKTVPNIFINGKHIGGNSDLQLLAQNGKLQSLLQ